MGNGGLRKWNVIKDLAERAEARVRALGQELRHDIQEKGVHDLREALRTGANAMLKVHKTEFRAKLDAMQGKAALELSEQKAHGTVFGDILQTLRIVSRCASVASRSHAKGQAVLATSPSRQHGEEQDEIHFENVQGDLITGCRPGRQQLDRH